MNSILITEPATELSVIIVNYNTLDYLSDCLQSISDQSDVPFETIVVDNASRDESQQMVKQDFPWVKLIANNQNIGFGAANNQAIKICRGKYVYFLNPDTRVKPGCFKELLAFMKNNPQIGLAGTKMLFPDKTLHPSIGYGYPRARFAGKALKKLPGDIAWVLGASMISPVKVIKALKGFDESFFLYGEEQNLCLRIRKNGFLIGYIPDAVVFHWGAKSERGNLPEEIWSKKIRAEYLFYNKHYPENAVRSIRRSDLLQAHWRVFSLKLMLPFARNKKKLRNKLSKYNQVIKILT